MILLVFMEPVSVMVLAFVLLVMKGNHVMLLVKNSCDFLILRTIPIVYSTCEENFCLNGATCQILAGDYLCFCADGYKGPSCNFSNKMYSKRSP